MLLQQPFLMTTPLWYQVPSTRRKYAAVFFPESIRKSGGLALFETFSRLGQYVRWAVIADSA
jgi:hypothetical protein